MSFAKDIPMPAPRKPTTAPSATKSPRGPAPARPTPAQRRYLQRGLNEPGGKLPLFDEDGQEIPRRTVEACLAAGWAERWAHNPIKPDWLVCRLTEAGRAVAVD